MREMLGGRLAYCFTADKLNAPAEDWYGHYVLVKNRRVLDIAGVYAEGAKRAYYRKLHYERRINPLLV